LGVLGRQLFEFEFLGVPRRRVSCRRCVPADRQVVAGRICVRVRLVCSLVQLLELRFLEVCPVFRHELGRDADRGRRDRRPVLAQENKVPVVRRDKDFRRPVVLDVEQLWRRLRAQFWMSVGPAVHVASSCSVERFDIVGERGQYDFFPTVAEQVGDERSREGCATSVRAPHQPQVETTRPLAAVISEENVVIVCPRGNAAH
jgi:hypothetical protein